MIKSRYDSLRSVLDLPESFDDSQLRRSYLEQLQIWHPDKNQGAPHLLSKAEERTKLIVEAYGELKEHLASGVPLEIERTSPTSATESSSPPTPFDTPTESVRTGFPSWFNYTVAAVVVLMLFWAGADFLEARKQHQAAMRETRHPRITDKRTTVPFPLGATVAAISSQYPGGEYVKSDEIESVLVYTSPVPVSIAGTPAEGVVLRFAKDRLYQIEVILGESGSLVFSELSARITATPSVEMWMRGTIPVQAFVWRGDESYIAAVGPAGRPYAVQIGANHVEQLLAASRAAP